MAWRTSLVMLEEQNARSFRTRAHCCEPAPPDVPADLITHLPRLVRATRATVACDALSLSLYSPPSWSGAEQNVRAFILDPAQGARSRRRRHAAGHHRKRSEISVNRQGNEHHLA